MENDSIALEALRDQVDPNSRTADISKMVLNGFRSANEPFVTSILRLWRAWSIKYLKEKAKLQVKQGACVLGCVDETATLRGHFNDLQPAPDVLFAEKVKTLPEVFIQVKDPNTNKYKPIESICIIARNPSLHQGDIRVVKAVNCPGLLHLYDVLVLPQTGDRDLGNMCSGGDLDGDDYVVSWDEDLLPLVWNAAAMNYEGPTPVRADGEVTTNDIIKFFHQYMRNDFLGRIAHAHMGWADSHEDGIKSPECLTLALEHSKAVDYAKTGVPAKLPKALDRFEWPHFMEKKSGRRYRSKKVLGQLYDAVERVAFVPNYDGTWDTRILRCDDPSEAVLQSVTALKREYDTALQRIMAQHEIKTEFEVWSTFVLDHSKASPDYKFHEEIGNLSKTLIDQFRESVAEEAGGSTFEHLAPYAIAAYKVTHAEHTMAMNVVPTAENKVLMPFISFPWVLHDVLGAIATLPEEDKDQRVKVGRGPVVLFAS